ncbi:ABC transporter permease [Aerococcaceae bacterium zg-ZJ1578]|uniref:ABC transporter permease n=1 Tax=Aerococcaceae TaxID=186827 RepID=UPI0013B87202|nr:MULTISPECIES: ABC transporter permease [unclassified Facklamia]MBK0347625.1 ABC transporter permease [Aerococcaceae bacterium zg-1578]MBR7927373.1 ABC transporter permease [Aerococcaceae bacterium zg-ZUI334]MBS4461424.1 ABC transporter permease [Aerococcaceae bacterium zg-B36]QQD65809.1 ABC transporter permease [Aerococcaceae bacterium zg-252]NEW64103.1 ABC transporter permease [Facklamia sp. 252]
MENNENLSLFKKIEKTMGLQKLIALIALIVIFSFFAVSSESFRSFDTVVSIMDASYYIGFLAIGVTFVIITGGIDLSLGTVMMCSTIIGGVLHTKMGWPLWLALLAILVIGGVFGLFNGIMVAKFGLPPFIATLGTMMVTRGLSSIVSNVQSVTFPLRSSDDGWYKNIFRTQNNFPTGLIVLTVIAITAAIVLNKTKIGRYIFAIGSNKEATRLSGVDVVKWETIAYLISGLLAGLAGIAYAATYSTILPGTGNGFELDAIAGVVVGGTSLSGGVGSILGTVIGVFIMSVLKIGLPYIDLQPHYQLFITGFVVIVAVYSDILIRKNKK